MLESKKGVNQPFAESNRRIAKNTLLLYFRMFITMGVSLYTSRIILSTLGIVDYGIFNVVGGVVVMFSFLNNSMSSATQRFLSFELGKNNQIEFKRVFSMSITIHVVIAIIIFIIAEIIGLWFINFKLNIPSDRLSAANWVYQFAILSFMTTVINVPYNAAIIAHEKLNVYAWISIFEVGLKLIIVFLIVWINKIDKLILYSLLIFCVSLLIFLFYRGYAKRNISECKYNNVKDYGLFKKLISYAGWNLWGTFSGVAANEGLNILLNIFFGPVLNAAKGIANQVNGAVNGFVSNFQMAVNPQIVKSYASENRKYMFSLIFQSSKFSFFLLFFLSLPVLFAINPLLSLWLKIVPNYTCVFCQLILITALIDCISGPLMSAAQASGNIKWYQVIVGGTRLLILPFSYFLLKNGYEPQSTLYMTILVSIISLFLRLFLLRIMINLSFKAFTVAALFPILKVLVISLIIPLAITWFDYPNQGTIFMVFSCFLSVAISVYIVGINASERLFFKGKIKLLILKTIK